MPTDKEILLDFGNKIVEAIRKKQLEKGIAASGASASGLEVKATDVQLQVIDTKGYFEFQEFGRRPGKRPPFQNILAWVKLKQSGNIAGKITDEQRAWSIVVNIGKHGTRAYQNYKSTGKGTGVLSEVINDKAFDSLKEQLAHAKMFQIQTEVKRLFNAV